jgi:hypothetical protein
MRVVTSSGSSDPDAAPSDPDAGPESGARERLRAIVAAVGLTVAALLVSLVGGVALAIPVFLFELDVESTPVFLGLTIAGQLGFLAVGYAYARSRGLRIRVARPGRAEVGYAIGGTVAALAAAIALSYLLNALGLVPGSVIAEAATRDPTVLLGLAALSVVVVAPIEEFLYRGVVQGRLREAFGPAGAVAGASLLFGSIHLANYTGALGPALAGTLLVSGTGVVLGTIYERTRNLVVPVAAHALYNVVLLGIAYLGA